MLVIAWSPNLSEARASAAGASWVERDELFRRADVLTIHLVLSERTQGSSAHASFRCCAPALCSSTPHAVRSWMNAHWSPRWRAGHSPAPYRIFYTQALEDILAYLAGTPLLLLPAP